MRTIVRQASSPRAIAVVVAVAFFGGCSAVKPPAPAINLQPATPRVAQLPRLDVPQPLPLPSDTEPSLGTGPNFDTEHREVADFLDEYQTNLRSFMEGSLERAGRHLSQVESILDEDGVPRELAYLPIVESGFQLNAVSRAGAAGPWQFMRHTGRRYGLRIDQYVDERRDLVKATRAAARYLRDLHAMFGDWHLSLAAYNSGEAKVAQVLERASADDFWQINERGYLPRETCEFVPRFLAAMEIGKSPETYGFDMERNLGAANVDSVVPPSSMSLGTIARLTGSDLRTIQELNPALNRGVAPSGYPVLVPRGTQQRFETGYLQLSAEERTVAAQGNARQHRVRRGETASTIARKYGVSVKALLQANRLKSAKVVKVGAVLHIPGSPQRPIAGQRVAISRKGSRHYD